MLTSRERKRLDEQVGPIRVHTGQSREQAIAVEASSFAAAYALDTGQALPLAPVEAALRARP